MPVAARSRFQGDGTSRCCAGPAAKVAARSRIDLQAGKGVVRARNRLDATPTYALLPQLETGKINCVRPPSYGRLPSGARSRKRSRQDRGSVAGSALAQFLPSTRSPRSKLIWETRSRYSPGVIPVWRLNKFRKKPISSYPIVELTA